MAAKTESTKLKEVKPVKQLPMVGWYHPPQLAKTGIEVAVSTIFGRHSDHRLVEAMAAGDHEDDFFDYSCYYRDDGKEVCELDPTRPRDSIWIDYVGDVGDGWNSTYAVAYHLAKPTATFTYTDQKTGKKWSPPEPTKRGAVMVFGGDEVYPTASREEYDQRLVVPYDTALHDSGEDCPHVFAIPGNHDWYDSLVAFTRLFTARPWFAGWRTRQTRSYFALKLPHNWWLLGTDLQLGSDIDKPQMEYFEKLAARMDEVTKKTGEPARVIVCHAEPHWIRAAQYGGDDPNYNESNLKLLEKRLGTSIAVFIAGDLHHYRRHESEDKSTQKITAGGGGAFLHPTHYGRRGKSLDTLIEKDLKENERKFKLRGCFPSTDDSRRACWWNLAFPYMKGNGSRTFGLMTAVLYLLLTLPISLNAALLNDHAHFHQITYTAIRDIFGSALSVFLIVAIFFGFIFFTDTHSKLYKWVMGGLHGVAHILAAFFIAIGAVLLTGLMTTGDWILHIPWFGGFSFPVDTRIPLLMLLIIVGGFVLGSFIMGLYLLVSLNYFGRHGNEAFSSLGIQDWKNFLRLHINKDGDLTIYPIGIRTVPRKWRKTRDGSLSRMEPDPDDPATQPELIELPIVMKGARTETGVENTTPAPVPSSSS
jgi:Calcineurin-like phosphoesterase